MVHDSVEEWDRQPKKDDGDRIFKKNRTGNRRNHMSWVRQDSGEECDRKQKTDDGARIREKNTTGSRRSMIFLSL